MTARTATQKPTDSEPFDFNLDQVRSEAAESPWRVNWAGRRWEFAHMDSFDVWPFLKGASADGVDEMSLIFRTALGEEQWTDFQEIPIKRFQMKALFDGYQTYCGVQLGESAASSDS